MSQEFDALCRTIRKLRSPEGCPWDRKQTPESLRPCLIEECFETVNAIDANDIPNIREELGDIFLNIVMISEIYRENGSFTVTDVLKEVNEKLIRRHPHVFGDVKADNAESALASWNSEKEKEKTEPAASLLDTVPESYPPLLKAWKMQQKAAKIGFDWPDPSGPKNKIDEEIRETEAAALSGNFSDLEEECGDLLFAIVNWCRHLKVNPVTALNKANEKFARRFRYVEKECRLSSSGIHQSPSLEEMNLAWEEAKKAEIR